jgi:hypothetical protein
MAKRLIEYHGDNIVKNDPQFRRIYEIKQAVSNLNVAVSPQSHFELNYSFVGNTVKASYFMPTVNIHSLVTMDPSSLAPTSPQEVNSYLEKEFGKKWKAELGYLFYVKTFRLTVFKQITPVISADFTQTLAMNQNITAQDLSRESLTFGGLKLTF